MGAPAKFLFDIDFAAGAEREATIALSEHALKLAEAEAAGHRKGYEAAQNDAKVQSDRRIAAALERIAAHLVEASGALRMVEARLECEAVEVAAAVARKLAPALIEREPFAEIAALASGCFRELVASPHIVVRVSEATYAAARERLEGIARGQGFEGRMVVLAEPGMADGDCRIEWADGGIKRDRAATDAAIAEAVARYVDARRGAAAATQGATQHATQEVRE